MLASCFQDELAEAGCDEAGRGCLAGPVFAASVIFPRDYKNRYLNDSKKLSEKKRFQLRKEIESDAVSFSVSQVSAQDIDKINILKASFLAMHKAIKGLSIAPGFLIIDGNRFAPFPRINHRCIVKGDAKFLSIAAASVLAKTYRDDWMNSIHNEFPEYCWNENKGYGTARHCLAIDKFGISPHHRKSFKLKEIQLEFW